MTQLPVQPTTHFFAFEDGWIIVLDVTDVNSERSSVAIGGGLTKAEAVANALAFTSALGQSIWATKRQERL